VAYTLASKEGFGDTVAPRHGGPSAKYAFLRDAKRFLRAVAKGLPSEVQTKVTECAGGFAVPGSASLNGYCRERHLHVSLVYRYDAPLPALLWRIGTRRYASDGVNRWIEDPTTTPQDVTARLQECLMTIGDTTH